MKVWKQGLTTDHWRIVRGLKNVTHCIHGRSLLSESCPNCTSELQYDGEDDRPWRSAQAGADGVFCAHGVSLDSECKECQQDKADSGDE